MRVGEEITKSIGEPHARRQSLQWQIQTKGRWTGSELWGLSERVGCKGRSACAGMEILKRIALQLQPPETVKGSGGSGIFGLILILMVRTISKYERNKA